MTYVLLHTLRLILFFICQFIFILLSTLIIAHFFLYVYPNGSFEGSPAFLGYFFGVGFSFFTKTNDRSMSVPGSVIFSTLSILPPSRDTALFAPSASASISPDLYAMKYPPAFTNGRQYSTSVDKLATARDTLMSNCSR